MNTHARDIPPAAPPAAPPDAPLSSHAATRRDEILADLLTRAPAIRRARTRRRAARIAAAGIAPLLLILTAVAITRPPSTTPTRAAAPLGPVTVAPPEQLAQSPAPADGEPTRPSIRIVSTEGRSFEHLVAPSRSRPELIDDDTLLTLLAREGKSEGIIHIQGRAILTSDLASAPALPLPPSLSPPQSSL